MSDITLVLTTGLLCAVMCNTGSTPSFHAESALTPQQLSSRNGEFSSWAGADTDRDGVPDSWDLCPYRAGDHRSRDGCTDRDGDGIRDDIDQCIDEPECYNGLRDDDGCHDGTCWREEKDMRARIYQRILFVPGSTEVGAIPQRQLDVAKYVIENNPTLKVLIEGHTDDVEIRTTAKQLRLSSRRAEQVKRHLEKLGIPSHRMEVRGSGASRPECDVQKLLIRSKREERACRMVNRRVQFHILEFEGKLYELPP